MGSGGGGREIQWKREIEKERPFDLHFHDQNMFLAGKLKR
jgi:hypothetical protein